MVRERQIYLVVYLLLLKRKEKKNQSKHLFSTGAHASFLTSRMKLILKGDLQDITECLKPRFGM